MSSLIFWLWTAYDPPLVHVIDLKEWWSGDPYLECLFTGDPPDVAWLGEVAWTGTTDNMGVGLHG